jgi:hypothetical protein
MHSVMFADHAAAGPKAMPAATSQMFGEEKRATSSSPAATRAHSSVTGAMSNSAPVNGPMNGTLAAVAMG